MSNKLQFTEETNRARFIDTRELQRRVAMSRRALYDWRISGKLPFVRVGKRRLLFHWPSVEAALLRFQKEGES